MFLPNSLYERLIKLAYELDDLGDEKRGDELRSIARKTASMTIRGSMPPSSVVEALVLLMKDLGINYAILGGLAVGLWGNPRSTDDVDVLVDRIPPIERTRDKEYMRQFGFRPAKSYTGTILMMDHDKGYVELLLADTAVKQFALGTAVGASVLGIGAKVVSAEGLVATKVQASTDNPKRMAKDVADVQGVLLTSSVDLNKVRAVLSAKENELLASIEIKKPGEEQK